MMPVDPILLLAFIPAALALNLTPGADMLFCLAQGVRGGARPAFAASAGISAGSLVNTALAGLGLGAVVASEPWLFGTIRYLGVAYLIWLAIKTLRSPLNATDTPDVRPSRAFRDGFIVNLSNPKVILFILAFIPQFVNPSLPVLPQFLLYGGVLAFGGFFINGAVGYFAGSLGRTMTNNARVERGLRITTASVFGALALKLAWDTQNT